MGVMRNLCREREKATRDATLQHIITGEHEMFNSHKANHKFRNLFSVMAAVSLAAWMTASSAMAAPADLDTTFGTGGKVTTNSPSSSEEGRAVVVQPDGKIIVVGYHNASEGNNFLVARYNPNGTLDTTFDGDGFASTTILNGEDYAYAVALQPDGKIVVAGQTVNNMTGDFALMRYNPNGSLDTSFDGDGIVVTSIYSGYDLAFAVAVQPDGKIVAAGSATSGQNSDFALVRYNANGSLDTSFDTDGKVTTPFSQDIDEIYAIALQADGKIIAVGYVTEESGIDFALARYNPNGSLDTSFDTDGKVTTQIFDGLDIAQAVALQADGKIVVAGQTFHDNALKFALARYQANGSLDASFDTDGKTSFSILGSNDAALAVAVQPDGKIVAAGSAGTGTQFDFAVARLNANGSPDTSFDTDGKLTTQFTNGFDGVYGAAVQPDGRIVTAGFATNNGVRNFALTRYMGDARQNRTANFDSDNKTDIAVWNPANGFWHVLDSSNNMPRTPVQWGNSALGDRAVPGDYDGDAKTDIAVWRESTGTFYILQSGSGNVQVIQWGQTADKPVQGDYDADGKTDVAIFRPSTGAWYIRNSSDNSLTVRSWGANGDQAVPADYDGDGATDIAIWRESAGNWYIITSRDRFMRIINWGKSGDKPVPADYDGDGRVDVAIFRPSEGNWHIWHWNGVVVSKRWGISTDVPVSADYDGDGRADIAVYRSSELSWYIDQSATNTPRHENLGQPGVPLASTYFPQQ
jgi:uncharacterized delta-60 repeat protein